MKIVQFNHVPPIFNPFRRPRIKSLTVRDQVDEKARHLFYLILSREEEKSQTSHNSLFCRQFSRYTRERGEEAETIHVCYSK